MTREYRLSQIIHALDTAAGDDRIKAVALDLDIFTGGGQSAIANVGEALDRVRRAGKRVVAYSTGYSDDGYQLAAHADEIWLDPLGRGADRRAGRHQPLLCGPARAARDHRQRLPGRHLQIGGRALSPAATCRPSRARPARRSPTRSGRPGGRTSPGAAAGADRRLCRRSGALHRRRRTATWRGPRRMPAWSTGSATAPPSAGAWPSSPAPTGRTCRAATAPSITRPGSTSIRSAT